MAIHGSTKVAGSTDSGNTTIVVPVPAETEVGDTLTMFLLYDTSGVEPVSISGWTILGDGASSTTANVPAYSIWQRIADGTETSTYTATLASASSRAIGFMVASNSDPAIAYNSRHDEQRQNDAGGTKTSTRALTHNAGIGTAGGLVFTIQLLQATFYSSGTDVLTQDPNVTILQDAEQVSEGTPAFSMMRAVLSYQVSDDGPASTWDFAYTDSFHAGSVAMVIEFVGWVNGPDPVVVTDSFHATRLARPVFIKALPHQVKTHMLGD